MMLSLKMKIFKFISSATLCFLIAFLGGMATTPSIPTWYASLNKPFFNPPNWIFGPVWTTLYFLMAVSLYIIWDKKLHDKKKEAAIRIFIFQLTMNLLWSLVFFGFHQPFLALITIIVLWKAIFVTIKHFYEISKVSAYILIPYLAWVSFASILNLAIAALN
jgi:translocator protein